MDTTFISIHDLSQDARILYASASITEILGFTPEEVVGRSCWDYFHPEELPFARTTHGRGVSLDRAAVLSYCRIRSRSGRWVGCECVFTVVYDVLIGCTSIYHQNLNNQRRARDAPIIRQIFSSSPRDPRYDMLSYISSKFTQGPTSHLHEPRAALFLNRFTRSLTVMYATSGLANVLGITAPELVGKSFYFCIAEACLPEAIRCLESAKANDSIAYLRFWYRDPRQDDLGDSDEHMSDGDSTDQDSEGGGVRLSLHEGDERDSRMHAGSKVFSARGAQASNNRPYLSPLDSDRSGVSSGTVTDIEYGYSDRVFEHNGEARSSATSLSVERSQSAMSPAMSHDVDSLELEAVVSCTSDGLVVVIREARPLVLDSLRLPTRVAEPPQATGYFDSPWGQSLSSPDQAPISLHAVAPLLGRGPSPQSTTNPRPSPAIPSPTAGGSSADFMRTIREVAVFAWALTGINGSLAQYARGRPAPGAQPYGGLPVWQPDAEQMRQNMPYETEDQMNERRFEHELRKL